MYGIIRAFKPFTPQTSVTTVAGTTNANVPVTANGTRAIRIVVSGTQTVYIDFSGTATVAGSMPMLANTIEVFTIGTDVTSYGVIAAAGGSTVTHTLGEGL